ncbi:cryptochrome/photolyase family protein [Lyngbya confervoides]|uniref:Cryptochrome/photolyase family protein n=1 Tax=Lyngbya confervoides BDU141951 TaxID=1574623 RepID=A0ABD4T3G3_9CYAN|nr:cryptochrome/photolyase family protein [Lyngbya confervoides]MCM1983114.1 cryptochrome/photolyase family protein [Lyngbya confervoides BDU141951]
MIVLLGNMLFPRHEALPLAEHDIFMAEDAQFCRRIRYHKHKIILVLSAMRHHRDCLRSQGHVVHYWEIDETSPALSYEEKLSRTLAEHPSEAIHTYVVEDHAVRSRLEAFCNREGLRLMTHESPLFLTTQAQFQEYRKAYKRYVMVDFYKLQRRRLNILLTEDGQPVGDRWSFDDQNRESLPEDIAIPGIKPPQPTVHVQAVSSWVEAHLGDHPGQSHNFWLPVTREGAVAWMDQFFQERFAQFGPYEDALSTRDPFLFHSVLSPLMNLGILTPREVVHAALTYGEQHQIPLNCLEGFIRQIIGWREYIRGVYHDRGEDQRQSNHLGHTRQLTPSWYEGTTGLDPVDQVIGRLQTRGWGHHIERLMVMSNAMLLCEIHPQQVYRWFMEFFVDSADWVMVPNVYGMGQFAEGGVMMTKPYICGSNYLRKMGDYPQGDWCTIWDGLYWRFIHRQREMIQKNPRMSVMVRSLERMKPEKRDRLFDLAEQFLQTHTVNLA